MRRKTVPLMTDLIPPDTAITMLPVDQPVAVYYRQSSDGQIGNISTAIQTVDLPQYLRQRGWADDKIILIDMDAGVSGAKKIDERPGMKRLFGLITDRIIGTVACQDEDRLFRDVTQIQVNIFIEACRQSNVLVITPSLIYNFADPLMGTYHARQFRFKCEMAAEYRETVIRGKLVRARHRKIIAGQSAGGSTTTGYIIEEASSRYVPFGPFATVVNEYFRLFLSFAGNLRQTQRHIAKYGPYYPDPKECPPPDGYRADYHTLGRYPTTRVGLKSLLTNAMYVGHWTHGGTIIRWNNHPAVVPVDVFMQAFNYLSPIALDGSPNIHYRPFQENARPKLDESRPVERPIYAGMIQSQFDGKRSNVGIRYDNRKGYFYSLCPGNEPQYWTRSARLIDRALDDLVLGKLRSTFNDDAWQKAVAAAVPDLNKERRHKEAQIQALERTLEGYARNLDKLTNEDWIRRAEKQYEAAQAEQARLKAELATLDNEAAQVNALEGLKADIGPALERWSDYPRDKKRTILHRLIDRIEIEPTDENGTHIVVYWRDRRTTTAVLLKNKRGGIRWASTGLRSAAQTCSSSKSRTCEPLDLTALLSTYLVSTIDTSGASTQNARR